MHSSNTWLCQGPYKSLSVADKSPDIMKDVRKVALSAPSYVPQLVQEVFVSKSLQRLLRPEICFQRDPPTGQSHMQAPTSNNSQGSDPSTEWNAH